MVHLTSTTSVSLILSYNLSKISVRLKRWLLDSDLNTASVKFSIRMVCLMTKIRNSYLNGFGLVRCHAVLEIWPRSTRNFYILVYVSSKMKRGRILSGVADAKGLMILRSPALSSITTRSL